MFSRLNGVCLWQTCIDLRSCAESCALRDTIGHMSSDHFAPPPLSADNPLMPRLYQAAIGPLNTAYYQQQFERFDALGKPSLSWNWAAGLCTLGWMGLRGLWRPAAIYLGVLVGVALLWWGVGLHRLLPLPATLALLLGLLVAIAVPGFLGNMLYYRAVRQRTMQALSKSSTLTQAMEQLQAQAPTSTHLQWATSGQAASALVAASMAWAVTSVPTPNKSAAATNAAAKAAAPTHTQADMARALAALQANASTNTAPASAAEPVEPVEPVEPMPTASTEATAVASASTAALAANASAGDTPSKATEPPAPTAAPVTAPASEKPTKTEPHANKPVAHEPSHKHEKLAKADKPEKAAKPEKSDKADKPEPKTKPQSKDKAEKSAKAEKTEKSEKSAKSESTSSKAATTKGLQPGKYYLNSGIYARPDNAQRVVRQLQSAGLPVFTQTLQSQKGEVTRVRVGPLASRHHAELAAQKAQTLNLEAQVFHYAPD